MSVTKFYVGTWWLSGWCLIAFGVRAALQNRYVIGLRAYPRREHIRRYEQWMVMPLVSMSVSVATGVSTGLMVTGGLGVLWGFSVLSATFLMVVSLGLWFGLLRRASNHDVWGPESSLEAIHAELTDARLRERQLPSTLLDPLRARLETMALENSSSRNADFLRVLGRNVAWKISPWAGLGVLKRGDGVRVRIPIRLILRWIPRRPPLVTPLILCWLTAIIAGLQPATSSFVLGLIPLVIPGALLLAIIAARGEIIFDSRAIQERAVLIEESLAAVEFLDGLGVKGIRRSLSRIIRRLRYG